MVVKIKIPINTIQTVECGIVEAPSLYVKEDEAGKEYEKQVMKKGFRPKKKKKETWEQYIDAFDEWQDKQGFYDPADWEIHWWITEI